MLLQRTLFGHKCLWGGGLNDWKIVTLTPTEGCDSNEVDLANTVILEHITTIMAENIEVGLIGAFCTKDEDPYTLQEATLLTEYEPPLQLEEGKLVCKAKYFMKVPRARFWYMPMDMMTVERMDMMTVECVQPVILTELQLLEPTPKNPLPNTCKKREQRGLVQEKSR
jgi:hypothetical protein